MLVLWAHNSCMPGSVLEEQPEGSAAGELQGAGYKQNKSLWLSPTPGTWYFVFSDLHFCWLKKKYRSPGLTSICTSYLLQNDIQAWNPTWHNAGAGCWLHLAPLSAQVHFSMLLPPASSEERVTGYQMGTLCREISYPVVRLDNLPWRKQGDLCWNYS